MILLNAFVILKKVNQLIATSDSYKSFSEEGLLPLRNSPEYNSLSEDQKTNMDNFLCSIDNFVYFAETLIPKTILDLGPPSGGPSFDGESYLKAAWPKWLRCAAGIVGGALLGGLEGASAGSVVPVIGTVGGGIIGIIGGGLVGGAAAC